MKRKSWIVVVCVCLFTLASARPYAVKRLGLEQGLSNSYVVSITQDKHGFIWFATESGLNRFDGTSFVVYKRQNRRANSLNGNALNKVYADKADDVVWVASQRDGLNAFDCKTETFRSYVNQPGNPGSIASNAITDIINSSDGNLWLASYHMGVDYFDKTKKQFIHYNRSTLPGLVSDNVWSVAEDSKGNLYIGHVFDGLSVYSTKDKTIKNYSYSNTPGSIPGNDVRCLFIDNYENVWVGTTNGLALFDQGSGRFISFKNNPANPNSLISNFIYTITQPKDGQLWIGTETGGISILDIRKGMFLSPEKVSFQNIYSSDGKNGLSHPTVRSIFEDSFRNTWIATYGGGVNFISSEPDFFQLWQYSPLPDAANSLSKSVAWGLCTDNEGQVWVGTDGGGIDVFKGGQKTASYKKGAAPRGLSDNAVLSGFKDSKGILWFGTYSGGITRYLPREKKFEHFSPAGFTAKDIRCFYEDKNGFIWIGTNGDGLYRYLPESKELLQLRRENRNLTENYLRAVTADSDGHLWVGTFGQGLGILDNQYKVVRDYSINNGLHSNTITYIFRDSKNRMWVGTGEGLAVFTNCRDKELTLYTEENGLADSYIKGITEDEAGNIWISTNGGISRFNPASRTFHNYNHFDGVPIGDFMDGSVVKDKQGTVYFGSQNGVCYFNPKEMPSSRVLPPVLITKFQLYRNEIHPQYRNGERSTLPTTREEPITVNYNQNSFSISFNVLNYALANQVEYAYMLEGIDKMWYNSERQNEITFRNIPPGTYTFHVRAKIKNQEWDSHSTTLRIKVNPPWWLSWWAETIYLLAGIAILLTIIRFYKNKLKLENKLYLENKKHQQEQKLNDEKMQFYTYITHELRTPLTLIIGPLEDMLNDLSFSELAHKRISLIHQSAIRLLNLINKILDFRKAETRNMPLKISQGYLSKLIREIGLKYKELNRNENITLQIVLESDEQPIRFDEEKVYIIVDNLLSNAFKYTQKGEIVLTLRTIYKQKTAWAEIEVRDTGTGIPAEALPKIFDRYYQVEGASSSNGSGIGLALVKNLTELHEGMIIAESAPGVGSAFRLQLEKNKTYPNAIHLEDNIYESEGMNKQDKELPGNLPIILVVEDNQDILNYIADTFSPTYSVLVASNGKEGMDMAFENIPDVIISDIMMPEMDGIELCSILKKDIRTSHVPIILLTAKDSIQDKKEGYQVGADSYITKPFSAELLLSRVTNIMETRKKLAEQASGIALNKESQLANPLGEMENEFLQKITQIIEENIESEKMDVSFIADNVFMSHSTLYRKIKAISGLTANEFIRKVKMQQARQLLLADKYTISEIAFRVGINNIAYFRQCFKEEFKATPSEYLRINKQ